MTAHSLLSAVLADPFDDGVRLVYADWLEENEEPERAEFIRDNIQQCDRCSPYLYDIENIHGVGYHPERDPASGRREGGWTNCKSCNGGGSGGIRKRFTDHDNEILKKVVYIVRRGFVDEIRCTMAQWVGGECQMMPLYRDNGGYPWHNGANKYGCPTCGGTGRTPGIAKQVCEAWPVTTVTLTDAPPDQWQWRIWILNDAARVEFNLEDRIYATRAEGISALSHAALTYGRRLAGLPELENK